MTIHLVTVVGASADVLPHMLAHYRQCGVENLIIYAHGSSCDDPLFATVEKCANENGAVIAGTSTGPWITDVNPRLYRMARIRYPNDWFLLADQDELQVYPDEIKALVEYCDKHGYTYIEGALVDRLAKDGRLTTVSRDRPIWVQFPLGSFLTGTLLRGVANKIVAVKGLAIVGDGQHHSLSGVGCPPLITYVPVHHFKWIDSLPEMLRKRVAVSTCIRSDEYDLYTAECKRFLKYFDEMGRIDVTDQRFLVRSCEPTYPLWSTICEWRNYAPCFSAHLTADLHRQLHGLGL